MATPPISARVPYIATALPGAYDPKKLFFEFGKVARAIPPMSTTNVVAAYTARTTDDTILGNTTAGNFAITLPQPNQAQFWKATIKNVGTGTLTITGTIDGSANPTLAQYKSKTFQSDGVAYWLLASV